MRNKLLIMGLIIILVLSLAGCKGENEQITNLSMLKGGKTFAVATGTAADKFVLNAFPDAKLKYFNSALDCALAVKEGKADATVYDKPIMENIVAKNNGLAVLPELLIKDKYGFAVQQQNKELKTTIDSVVSELKANGTYDDMMKRWFPKQGAPAPMPDIRLTGNKGTLRLGTSVTGEPISYLDSSNKFTGFDIEMAAYIAQKLDMQLEVVNMEFGGLIPALAAGKVDMIAAGISITEERAKKVLFSESYYDGGIAVAVRSNTKTEANNNNGNKLGQLDDIADKRVGVNTGTIYDGFVVKKYPQAKILRYDSTADMVMAIKTDKIDVAVLDCLSANVLVKNNSDIGILSDDVMSMPLGIGFNKNNPALRQKFNSFLKESKANGTYDEIYQRWYANDPEKAVMPDIKNNNRDKKLVLGVAVADLPYVAVMNGKYVGFDIEMMQRFAAQEGYNLEIITMEFASLIASLTSGKVDMIADGISITEERSKQIDFSDCYLEGKTAVIAQKNNLAKYEGQSDKSAAPSFMQSISASFYNNMIVEQRYLLIVDGLKITAVISLFSLLFGTLLGGLICLMRMAKNRFLSAIARVYISILRGTPVLVLLMLIFYVVFASVNIDPVVVAVIAFGMNFAAYVSEMFRTAIESIDKGQKEAGIAGGFTALQTFIYIIMPQAVRQVLPVYKGEFISMVKMTSVVGYIAVQDLTKASDIIRSRTFEAFFPLVMVAVLYFIMSWLLALVLDYIGLKTDPKRNRNTGGASA
ncbi:MAG: ABC transporter permease subunit [Syntrophomonas sp.]